ncbi:MAG: reverse transcriptase domain-containing protein, partial [Marinobacter sp.]
VQNPFAAADSSSDDDDAAYDPESDSDAEGAPEGDPPEDNIPVAQPPPAPNQGNGPHEPHLLRRSRRARRPNPRFHDETWTNLAADFAPFWQTRKFRHSSLNDQFLAALNWTKAVETIRSDEFSRMWSLVEQEKDFDLDTFEWIHPLILAAKANTEDNPSWEEAMNGPLADGYWEAARKEIDTLERMDVWEVVDRLAEMNVLPSTWAFKCKRFPDGSVRKLKGRFCCRGDRQIDGVDYDSEEIFSPVVSWHTVRLLLGPIRMPRSLACSFICAVILAPTCNLRFHNALDSYMQPSYPTNALWKESVAISKALSMKALFSARLEISISNAMSMRTSPVSMVRNTFSIRPVSSPEQDTSLVSPVARSCG